ncbi:MAG: 1-acyl-sn-glycerol-3-phosphate acyltransferase [Candidatus Omnitrophica bacterium]|nr:1-acyl-sn-glycerol-3-phosphate acyltransferase [Candidatus Omnitrophota bacterium]
MIYSFFRLLSIIVIKIFARVEVKGGDSIPLKGAFIMASNHLSNIDPFLLGAISPRRLNYLAKEELFKGPFISALFYFMKAFPVKRNKADISALRNCLNLLKNNEPMLVFPEGTRASNTDKIYAGVGFLVKKSGVPVIPARVYNTDKVLARGQKFPRFAKVKVIFGKPLKFGKEKDPEQIARDILSVIKTLD